MSPRSNLWRFFACVAVAFASVVALWLPRKPSPSDIVPVAPENRALSRIAPAARQDEFAALVREARMRPGWECAALRDIANERNIDLSAFFPELADGLDNRGLPAKNTIILNHILAEAKTGVMLDLTIAPDALSGLDATQRGQKLSRVEEVLRARLDAQGASTDDIIVTRPKDDTLRIALAHARDINVSETLQKNWIIEFRLVHPFQRPTLAPNVEIPAGYEILASEQTHTGHDEYLFVQRRPLADGRIIARAFPALDTYGMPQIVMEFTKEGRAKFTEVTRQVADHTRQLHRQTGDPATRANLAIVLDGKLLSYPGVTEPIDSPSAQITGNFTQLEAHNLAAALNNPLDIPLAAGNLREVTIPPDANKLAGGALRAALYILLLASICMAVRFAIAIKPKNAQAITPPPIPAPPTFNQ